MTVVNILFERKVYLRNSVCTYDLNSTIDVLYLVIEVQRVLGEVGVVAILEG